MLFIEQKKQNGRYENQYPEPDMDKYGMCFIQYRLRN